MIKIEWKEVEQRYGSSEHQARVGKIKVGYVAWNNHKSKQDVGVDHVHNINLPGLRSEAAIDKHPTIEVAKAQLERVVTSWFNATGVLNNN